MVRGIVAPDARTGHDPLVSPLPFADLTGLSPTYVATAEFDVLRDEGVALVAALRQAKVHVDHSAGPGMVHGFANFAGVSSSAKAEVDAAIAWLARLLAKNSSHDQPIAADVS